MTNEEYKKIRELEYKAKQCRAEGINPEIDDGTAWAMTHTRQCKMVTDGQRFWEQPRLILEFDVFQGGVVTIALLSAQYSETAACCNRKDTRKRSR